MIIVGAGGLAAQLFDDLIYMKAKNIVFWSETETTYRCLKENFDILKTDPEVMAYFTGISRSFVVAVWDIESRKRLIQKFTDLGGELVSFITELSYISSYTSIGAGSIILYKAGTEPDVTFGKSCIINKNTSFGHGCTLSPFCCIGPSAIIASNVEIGENCYVGMGAIIQPNVKIGKNVIIAAGSIVTKNIADNAVVSGLSSKIRFFRKG